VFSYCIEKKADNMNQIIDELVELNKIIQTPSLKIGIVVNQIQSAAQDSAKAFKGFYSKVEGNCKAGFGYLKSFTTKLEGDLVGAKDGINKATARVKKNTAAAANFGNKLKSAKESLKRDHVRQAQESNVFRERLLEAHAKITTIRHIRNIVVDELLNGKAPASLIQVNTISGKLQELKTLVEKDNDSMFAAVVSTLLEMVSGKNLNDQATLKKFLGSLSKLNQKIRNWRKSAIADHKRLRKLNKLNNAAKLKSIRALGRLLIEAKSAVVGATKAIDELKNAVFIISKAIARKHVQAKNWDKLCKDQARVKNIFVTAYKGLKAKLKTVGSSLLSLQ
jgi:hypothetical protein